MFAAFKLKLYYFSKAVILVQFLMKFGVLGILCRIFIAYSIANHLIVNFSILIYDLDSGRELCFFCYRLSVIMWFLYHGNISVQK